MRLTPTDLKLFECSYETVTGQVHTSMETV